MLELDSDEILNSDIIYELEELAMLEEEAIEMLELDMLVFDAAELKHIAVLEYIFAALSFFAHGSVNSIVD
jgi:hypothetical protein